MFWNENKSNCMYFYSWFPITWGQITIGAELMSTWFYYQIWFKDRKLYEKYELYIQFPSRRLIDTTIENASFVRILMTVTPVLKTEWEKWGAKIFLRKLTMEFTYAHVQSYLRPISIRQTFICLWQSLHTIGSIKIL